jgi:FkbM family methyltransferase
MLSETKHLNREKISLFVDVGANIGQTGYYLRKIGFAGRIESYEPISEVFEQLSRSAAEYDGWKTHRAAVGDTDGTTVIRVSQDRVSSSIRQATPQFEKLHPKAGLEREEVVPVVTLDNELPKLARPGDNIFLKIDSQGFERNVMAGVTTWLPHLRAVRMEVAVTSVYDGEWTVPEAIIWMRKRKFVLAEVESAWRHPIKKRAMHFDLMFLNLRPRSTLPLVTPPDDVVG